MATPALAALMLASTCGARYFALEPGATWTYEFRFWEKGRFAMEQVGEHVQWIDGTVVRGGHEYGVSNGEYTLLEFKH
jgi:hypothetical protein